MSTTEAHYVLKPRPPLRAYVIAAVLVLLGAVLLALAAGHGTLLASLAALVLVLGLVLAGFSAWSMVKMRTFVDLDATGYTITAPGNQKSGTWAEVTRATTTAGGSHLVLHHGQVARTHVICPLGGDDVQMKALVADVARHLDESRGYGETMNVPLINPHQPADPEVVS